jgi:carboxymethylenebutenolidase
MSSTRTEIVATDDGGQFASHLALPETGVGPGLVLLQEIFGVNDYIKGRAATLADLGYTVLAPDLYWRIQPGIALPQDEEGLQKAFGYVQQLDRERAVRDAGAALYHLRRLPEVSGRVGVVGFCLGGALGYHVAAEFHPDVAVLYYGSGTAAALDRAASITCPVMFHFGEDDPYISREEMEAVRRAFGGRRDVEVHLHPDARHAFDNYLDPRFHRPAAREAAWAQTLDFLSRHFPTNRETSPPALA